jgi:MoxR-like ATPase
LEKFNTGFYASGIQTGGAGEVCSFEDIKRCREEIQKVEVNSSIINYITSIVKATRNSPSLVLGASPRASIALLLTAKTYAAMQGRSFITPEDIKDLALPVLRHRIILKPEAGIDGMKNDDILRSILNRVEVPR